MAWKNYIFHSIIKLEGHCIEKQIHNKLEKTQVDRMICDRVTTAANLKNVVLRKTRLKTKVDRVRTITQVRSSSNAPL